MTDYIPDPLEQLENSIERMIDRFVDEYTCMECGERKDYVLNTASARPDSPLICDDCMVPKKLQNGE